MSCAFYPIASVGFLPPHFLDKGREGFFGSSCVYSWMGSLRVICFLPASFFFQKTIVFGGEKGESGKTSGGKRFCLDMQDTGKGKGKF